MLMPKNLKRVAVGILLGIGIPVTLFCLGDFLRKDNPRKANDIVLFLLCGLPPIATAGLLIKSLTGENATIQANSLQSIFYQLLKENKGRITIVRLAMETHLSAEESKQYLDKKAVEFEATFDVNNEGAVFYCFNVGEISNLQVTPLPKAVVQEKFDVILQVTPLLKAVVQEKFDVILESVPDAAYFAVIRVLEVLVTDSDWFKAVNLARSSAPTIVKRSVDQATAELLKQKLEAAGAKVTLK